MTSPWRRRAVTVVVVWSLLAIGMVVADMEPQVVLLGLVVLACASVIWVLTDLTMASRSVIWHPVVETGFAGPTTDARIGTIRMRIHSAEIHGANGSRLHSGLVEIVDDQLSSVHGIDRFADPAAARRVLGDELMQFVSGPPPTRLITDPVSLGHIVSLIEQIGPTTT